jgi:hypothetical protein
MGEVSAGQVGSILRSAQELWEENGRAFLRPSHTLLPSAEQKIRAFVKQVAGPGVEVELVEPKPEKPGEAMTSEAGNNEPTPSIDAADNPLVTRTAQVFGATVVKVQRKGNGHA